MNALTLTILMSITGAAGDEIADALVERGIQRVGVVPTVISRKGDDESTVGSLGPRALTIARKLREDLVTLSSTGRHRGKFSVVSDRQMKRALSEANLEGPVTIEDLGDIDALQRLSGFTGAGAFVTLDKEEPILEVGAEASTDGGAKNEATTEVDVDVIVPNGTEVSSSKIVEANSLSTAAYEGRSFELRRFEGKKLLNLGIDTDGNPVEDVLNWEFGKGDKWDKVHYTRLRSELAHPLDIDEFPYDVTIHVDGKRRSMQPLGEEYVVPLEDGEEYTVELTNKSQQQALAALYIDGVSVIGKELLEPNELGAGRYWVLKPETTTVVEGWLTIGKDKHKPQQATRFLIAPRDESVAARQSFDGKIGMITAIFYANDAASGQSIDYPDDEPPSGIRSAVPAGGLGTAEGIGIDKNITFVKGERGLMLAAVTIFYRTQAEIDAIRDGQELDNRLAGDN